MSRAGIKVKHVGPGVVVGAGLPAMEYSLAKAVRSPCPGQKVRNIVVVNSASAIGPFQYLHLIYYHRPRIISTLSDLTLI